MRYDAVLSMQALTHLLLPVITSAPRCRRTRYDDAARRGGGGGSSIEHDRASAHSFAVRSTNDDCDTFVLEGERIAETDTRLVDEIAM